MALIRRHDINSTGEIIDDQSPTLGDSYAGNWTHYDDHDVDSGFNNDTTTSTPTSGASFTLNFSGTRVVHSWVHCVVLTLQ